MALIAGLIGGSQARFDSSGNLIIENVGGWPGAEIEAMNGGPAALTLGHVMLNTTTFDTSTPGGAKWLAHENAHIKQAELLGPAYLATYVVLYVLSGQVHDQHPMEIQADDYKKYHWQEYATP